MLLHKKCRIWKTAQFYEFAVHFTGYFHAKKVNLLVLDQATRNWKARWVEALKLQARSNLSSMICVEGKLELDKTGNTQSIWAKTWKTRLQTRAWTWKMEETWTSYVFELEVLKLDETQIRLHKLYHWVLKSESNDISN